MTHKETLIYLAGIVDGEGYIGIKKQRIKGRSKTAPYCERLSVAGLHKPMIELCHEFFGVGHIALHKPPKLSKRGYWSWEVTSDKAALVIKQLYPYLMIKKADADLVLALNKNKDRKYYIVPQEVVDYRESLYQAVKALHTFTP